MGYCDNQWVSDYTYTALLQRGQFVNLPKWQDAPVDANKRIAYDVSQPGRPRQSRIPTAHHA